MEGTAPRWVGTVPAVQEEAPGHPCVWRGLRRTRGGQKVRETGGAGPGSARAALRGRRSCCEPSTQPASWGAFSKDRPGPWVERGLQGKGGNRRINDTARTRAQTRNSSVLDQAGGSKGDEVTGDESLKCSEAGEGSVTSAQQSLSTHRRLGRAVRSPSPGQWLHAAGPWL